MGSSICASWPGVDEDRFTGPYSPDTATPVLVVGTRFDAATRYQDAVSTANILGRARLLTLDGWGPHVLFKSRCIDEFTADYLLHRTPPPRGATCRSDRCRSAADSTARRMEVHASQDGGMDLDVTRVRAAFPALAEGVAYFDGPGGSQVPAVVGRAIADTVCSGIANRGTVTVAERRADEVVVGARRAIADLIGCDPGGVVFGRSMTQLTYDLARTLAARWGPGDEVVVTRLDHDGNVRPWVQAAERVGATVRWAGFDRFTGELPVAAVTELLSERTRVVAVTAASNLLGTRPDVAAICAAAQAAGALAYVDGVHLTPHAPVDVGSLGADVYVCSPYKFFGPHHGVLAADPALLASLRPDKLLPQTNAVPECFELGTLPYELLAGTTATVDFIADLAPGAASGGDRRSRVLASMTAAERHEHRLFTRLLAGLEGLDGVTVHGRAAHRTPTALFSVAGRSPDEVAVQLAAEQINAPAGSFYAIEAAHWIGLGDPGAIRAGLAPYTNDDDVDRLLDAVARTSESTFR